MPQEPRFVERDGVVFQVVDDWPAMRHHGWPVIVRQTTYALVGSLLWVGAPLLLILALVRLARWLI